MRMAMSSKPPITFSSWHVSTDPEGRLVTETRSDGFEIRNRYDFNGNKIERQSNLGSSVHFAFDGNGELVEADIANCVTLSIVRGIGPSNTNTENSTPREI